MAEGYRDNLAETLRNVHNSKLGGTEKELARNLRDTAKETDEYQSAEQEQRTEAKDARYEKLVSENAELKTRIVELERQAGLLDQIKGLLEGRESQQGGESIKKIEQQIEATYKETQLVLQEIDKFPIADAILGDVTGEHEKGVLIHDLGPNDLIITSVEAESLEGRQSELSENVKRAEELKRVLADLIANRATLRRDQSTGNVYAYSSR